MHDDIPDPNHNARESNPGQHSLTPEEQKALIAVKNAAGLSWEIDRLRAQFAVLADDPNVDLKVFLRGARLLVKAIRVELRMNSGRRSRN